MSDVTDDRFDASIAAWLDDEAETGLPELDDKGQAVNRQGPSDGAKAADRAAADADSHPLCPKDTRDFAVLVAVYGQDGVKTIISVPPERTLKCVLGAFDRDEEVVAYQVLGFEPPTTFNPAVPEPEDDELSDATDDELFGYFDDDELPEIDHVISTALRATVLAGTALLAAGLYLYLRHRRR